MLIKQFSINGPASIFLEDGGGGVWQLRFDKLSLFPLELPATEEAALL